MLISVVIPTSNRPQLLAQLLEALRAQEMNHLFEIIIVDDCEHTNLNYLSFETERCKCTILRGEGKGPARARNLGASHAVGTYLVFLDDDSVVGSFYLARISSALEQRPGYALSGPQLSIDRENAFSLTAEWLADHLVEAERLNSNQFGFAASNGFALRRVDFQQAGAFNPHFPLAAGEDREFCTRWIAAGFHIEILEDLAVQHRFPATLATFAKQQWRYGRGAAHFETCVSVEKRPRVRSLRFYFGVVLGPIRHHGLSRGVRVSLLAALSQFIVWAGYMSERRSASANSVPGPARVVREEAK